MKQDSKLKNTEEINQEGTQYAGPDEKRFLQEFMKLAEIGVFIKKDTICVRAFSLTNSNTILAYVLAEMNDFFILAFPSTVLTTKGGFVEVKQISVVPMIKMYKNMTNISIIPPPQVLHQFLAGTRNKLSELAGYFHSARVNQVNGVIEALKLEYNLKDPILINEESSSSEFKDDKDPFLKELAKSLNKQPTLVDEIEKDLYEFGKNKKIRYKH